MRFLLVLVSFHSWLLKTVPPLVSHWSRDAEPYFMQLVDACSSLYDSLSEAMAPAIVWMSETIPVALEKVSF